MEKCQSFCFLSEICIIKLVFESQDVIFSVIMHHGRNRRMSCVDEADKVERRD